MVAVERASDTVAASDAEIRLRRIDVDDAGEVLTLQRAAFVQEALVYAEPDMPPLTQTLDQLRAELQDNAGYVAVRGQRIVGAVRARIDGDLLLIGRIAIAPDHQGSGVGTSLLAQVEERGRHEGCTTAELFTGSLSDVNLRLYRHLGYVESERVDTSEDTAQVFLRKALTD